MHLHKLPVLLESLPNSYLVALLSHEDTSHQRRKLSTRNRSLSSLLRGTSNTVEVCVCVIVQRVDGNMSVCRDVGSRCVCASKLS